MEPNIWGPGAWLFLHSITLNYPNKPNIEQKKIYSDFFYQLGKVLPCSKCQKHYFNNINKYPINFHLKSKESLSKWLVNIHNEINILNNKPIISYKTFIDNIEEIYNDPFKSIEYYKYKNKYQSYIIYTLILIIITIGIYQYYN